MAPRSISRALFWGRANIWTGYAVLTCRLKIMKIHPAIISGVDMFTANFRPIQSISHPAGTAMAKLPMSMHTTINDIWLDDSDMGALPTDMYSMTGDGHPSTTPAMNTGKDAVNKTTSFVVLNNNSWNIQKISGFDLVFSAVEEDADRPGS